MPKGVGAKLPPPMKAKAPSVVAGGDAEKGGEDEKGEGGVDGDASAESRAAEGAKAAALSKPPLPIAKGVGAKLPPPMKAKAPSVVAGGPVGRGEEDEKGEVGVEDQSVAFAVDRGVGPSTVSDTWKASLPSKKELNRKSSKAECRAVSLAPKYGAAGASSDSMNTSPEADSPMLEALQIIPSVSSGFGMVCSVPALPFASVVRRRVNPNDLCFPETIADVELLFSRPEDVVTGSCFYNLGPKATVEASCGDQDSPFLRDTANPGTTDGAKALIALDKIKGLYDSPVSLLPWSQTQKSSASLSCTQISKLPPVQYTTALSVWSELILHQRNQVIAVVGCHSGNDRTVPSLISSFGLLKGSKLKEQMNFAEAISRLYNAFYQTLKLIVYWELLSSQKSS
ncbi:hypothetical protein Emag_007531 [Eimeria magna]